MQMVRGIVEGGWFTAPKGVAECNNGTHRTEEKAVLDRRLGLH